MALIRVNAVALPGCARVRLGAAAPSKPQEARLEARKSGAARSVRLRADDLVLSMVHAGWFDAHAVPMVLATAFAFGGTARFCAGLLELPRGNSFGFTAFCGYRAFRWLFALFVGCYAPGVPASFVGWYLSLWGFFTGGTSLLNRFHLIGLRGIAAPLRRRCTTERRH